MDIIPLIALKKGNLYDGVNGTALSLEDVFARVKEESLVYVLDFDGIDHDNPNLELYQRLTEHFTLWIDDGPRRIDDVMDTIMAGATNLTIRTDHWHDVDFDDIFELTDGEVFIAITQETSEGLPPLSSRVGAIVFIDEAAVDFTREANLKALGMRQNLYVYGHSNFSSWQENIAGRVVDLHEIGGNI